MQNKESVIILGSEPEHFHLCEPHLVAITEKAECQLRWDLTSTDYSSKVRRIQFQTAMLIIEQLFSMHRTSIH
jgi:hypothetical protein